MTLNPAYEAIGKGFVQQYYAMFDDPTQRPNLINMYNTETSFMTFEGIQLQGSMKIMEKLTTLPFQKINRMLTAVDSQPMFDGGVLINVLGRLQTGLYKSSTQCRRAPMLHPAAPVPIPLPSSPSPHLPPLPSPTTPEPHSTAPVLQPALAGALSAHPWETPVLRQK